MINHVHKDGSIGHEFENGDRVIVQKETYSLRNTPLGVKGKLATVKWLEPFNNQSTYHTTFAHVVVDGGLTVKELMCHFEPAEGTEPRKEIMVPKEILDS